MAESVKGIVEFMGSKGKAWNIKLNDGNWYGLGFKKPDVDIKKGDFVSFDFVVNGNFKNVNNNTIKVESAPTKVETAAPVAKDNNYWDRKDARISYHGAVNTAVEIVKFAIDKEMIKMPAAKNKHLDVFLAAADDVASQLYAKLDSGNFSSNNINNKAEVVPTAEAIEEE